MRYVLMSNCHHRCYCIFKFVVQIVKHNVGVMRVELLVVKHRLFHAAQLGNIAQQVFPGVCFGNKNRKLSAAVAEKQHMVRRCQAHFGAIDRL